MCFCMGWLVGVVLCFLCVYGVCDVEICVV